MHPLIVSTVIAFSFWIGSAFADEKPAPPVPPQKGPTCQESLNDMTVYAHNLATDRNNKESNLARAQVTIMNLQSQKAQLEKMVADLRKAMEPKTEKPKE